MRNEGTSGNRVVSVITLFFVLVAHVVQADPPEQLDVQAAGEFWSFRKPERHPLPGVERADWPRRDIDYFLLAGIEAAGLKPSEEADRVTLLRRLCADLIGLPPGPDDVEAFVNDPSPDAYDRAVERLLASPRYGERWARVWMDVSRYAEDQAHIVGNNQSLFYPGAHYYRSWLIRALNSDIPYDQFVRLQLAADLMNDPGEEHLAALGFLGLGPKYYNRGNPTVKADEWEDRIDVVTRGLQGLTVACSRCHDHKFDPISTEDYYGLAGVFASTQMYNKPLPAADLGGEAGDEKSPADKNILVGKKKQSKSAKKKRAKNPGKSLHIIRDGKPVDLKVYIRGDVKQQGAVVPRRYLTALGGAPLVQGSGRLQLAEAIVSGSNPLTARVIVNRIWALSFGRPIVGTPSNFGVMGEKPLYPELLDDLAVRFMEEGWSLKWLQREIVLSATYRQSSSPGPDSLEQDPQNLLLSHMNHRRLSVEAWRDAVLSVTGELDLRQIPGSFDLSDTKASRRTLYARISRFQVDSMLRLFDFPDPNAHSAKRIETITPLQKLFVLNSPFMVRRSRALAARLLSKDVLKAIPANISKDDALRARVEKAYAFCFSRSPDADELEMALRFFEPDSASFDAWEQYAQVLLATSEMLYVD